jgi:hypothetical protein
MKIADLCAEMQLVSAETVQEQADHTAEQESEMTGKIFIAAGNDNNNRDNQHYGKAEKKRADRVLLG